MLSVQFALIKPDLPGLDDGDDLPAKVFPEGLDYSRPWHDSMIAYKKFLEVNLHCLHHSTQSMFKLQKQFLSNTLLFSCRHFR